MVMIEQQDKTSYIKLSPSIDVPISNGQFMWLYKFTHISSQFLQYVSVFSYVFLLNTFFVLLSWLEILYHFSRIILNIWALIDFTIQYFYNPILHFTDEN